MYLYAVERMQKNPLSVQEDSFLVFMERIPLIESHMTHAVSYSSFASSPISSITISGVTSLFRYPLPSFLRSSPRMLVTAL